MDLGGISMERKCYFWFYLEHHNGIASNDLRKRREMSAAKMYGVKNLGGQN